MGYFCMSSDDTLRFARLPNGRRICRLGLATRGNTSLDRSSVEAALDAGATDVESSAESHEIRSDTVDFNQMREMLEEKFGAGRSSGLRWIPQTTV